MLFVETTATGAETFVVTVAVSFTGLLTRSPFVFEIVVPMSDREADEVNPAAIFPPLCDRL